MKRKVRLAYIRDCRNPERVGLALLFSTDINLDASEILCFYKSRFQIEFIFRDAKQFTGLSDCQARDLDGTHYLNCFQDDVIILDDRKLSRHT
jgi:hypothetical protein